MSGSLNIAPGTSNIWTAKTANNTLCPNQTDITVSGWFNFRSFARTSNSNVFTCIPIVGFLFQANTFGVLQVNCNTLTYNWSIALNRWVYIAATQTAGTSHIYLQAASVATKTGSPAFPATPTATQIGWSTAGSVDLLMADLAIWSGTALDAPRLIRLRDRVDTPASLDIPATSWWPLQGTAGAHPTLADPLFQDQIGPNNFTSISGTTTAALYSSVSPAYVPPVTVTECQIARGDAVNQRGYLAFFMMGSNPALGSAVPAYVTGVNTTPTMKKNGTDITSRLQGPFYSALNHQHPWAAYHYVDGFAPEDDVTWQTADSWLTTSLGNPPDESGTAGNYSGAYPPGLYDYLGFDPSSGPPSMELGWYCQAVVTGTTCPVKNARYRVPIPWFNAASSDPTTGEPLTIGTAFAATMFSTLWDSSGNNGIDSRTFPTPTGTWVVLGDETAPGSPMNVTFTANSCITQGPLTAPTIIGTGTNKRWEFTVGYIASPTTLNAGIALNVQTPTHTPGANTLRNIRVFEPGNDPDDSPGHSFNGNCTRMLTAETNVYSPCVRYMEALTGSDGAGSEVFPNDFPLPTDYGYNGSAEALWPDWIVNNPTLTGNRQIPIYQFRKYDVSVSPKVYCAQQYARTVTSDNAQAGAFMWDLAALGLGYDWGFHGADYNSHLVPIEVVCADNAGTPINHNLQSGQFLGIPQSIVPVSCADNFGHTGTVSTGVIVCIYVTGPHTFMYVTGVPAFPNTNKMIQITGGPYLQQTNGVNAHADFTVTGGFHPRIEDVGEIPQTLDGTAIWVAVNHCLNDDGVRFLATGLFNSLPSNAAVIPQWSNEILLGNAQNGWVNQLASIEGFRSPDPTTGTLKTPRAVMQRTAEVQDIFEDVFGVDSGRVVRIFQPFVFDPAGTTDALQYAQNNSIRLHAVTTALYIDMDFSPQYKMAAAMVGIDQQAVISGTPTNISIANPSNGGPGQSGILQVWVDGAALPMEAYHDLTGYHLKYAQSLQYPNGATSIVYNCIVNSGYGKGGGTSGFVFPFPQLYGYECAPSTMIPAGVSVQAKILRAMLTHDYVYNPRWADTSTAFYQYAQQPGPAGTVGMFLICMASLHGQRQPSSNVFICNDGPDNNFVECWQTFIHQAQQAGDGTSNLFALSNLGGDGMAHDWGNVSVNGFSGHNWIIAASGHVIPPTASFVVAPTRVPASHASPITLNLTGTNTMWTGGSDISITNSVSGTTTVTAGTFTASSGTSATLQVTTGSGSGTWRITIDGVQSPLLGFGSARRLWSSRMATRRIFL